MERFQNRLALVTGAASGIGRCIALALAREGADLALADVDERGLQETCREIEALGGKATSHLCDVTDDAAVEEMARWVRPDVLVNCAGVAMVSLAERTPLEEWRRIMEINFWGPVRMFKAFLPAIRERCGHIVNVASADGLFALPGSAAYCSSKFALVGFTEVIRMELRRDGVGVTAVCPGLTYTPMARNIAVGNLDRSRLDRFVSLARPFLFTTPERLADAVVEAIKRDRPLLVHTATARLLHLINRVSLRLFMALPGRVFLKLVRSLE